MLYGLHGLVLGEFYLPTKRGTALVLHESSMVLQLIACLLTVISLLIREKLILLSLVNWRTSAELLLLFVGLGIWLLSYRVALCSTM